jgi:hypothetical protein
MDGDAKFITLSQTLLGIYCLSGTLDIFKICLGSMNHRLQFSCSGLTMIDNPMFSGDCVKAEKICAISRPLSSI